MKVSDATRESVASISPRDSEITAQIEEDALGYCITKDATKNAISPE